MKNAEPGSEQHQWGEAIKVIRPVFATDGGGTHVNISGAAVARHAPNRDNAVALMEYLVSDEAQGLYARANYEYPVKAGVELDPVVASFGEMRSEEHTSELQSLMRISYAVFCLKQKKNSTN